MGAFSFVSGESKDSAILHNQKTGSFTAHLSNGDATRGNGMIEIYDASDSSAWENDNTARLMNLSARTVVPANQVLIAGFAAQTTTTLRLLIRGVGPTLARFEVPSPMADPQIKVYNAAGNVIA